MYTLVVTEQVRAPSAPGSSTTPSSLLGGGAAAEAQVSREGVRDDCMI